MNSFYAGLSAAVLISACATAEASAMTGPTFNAELALQHARTTAAVPNLSGIHTFSIITRSKADKDVAAVASYFKAFGMSVRTLAAAVSAKARNQNCEAKAPTTPWT